MSVVLQFQICQSGGCDSLQFTETTGIYNAISNPNGWGVSNESTSDALSAMLTIVLGNGSTYNINLFATGNFPTSDNTFVYNIINEDIGYVTGDSIPDQIITFTYTVTTATTTYTQVVEQAFYCNVQCCVNTMFLDLDFDCSECFSNQLEQALIAYSMLQGLKAASNCGNNSQFNNILTKLNKLCSNTNCSSCK